MDDRWEGLRRVAAREHADLTAQVADGDDAAEGWEAAAIAVAADLLAGDGHICDHGSVPACVDRTDPIEGFRTRCTTGYWRSHSKHVAANMGRLATLVDEPVGLWTLVGALHDADYPVAPHHVEEVDLDDAHPSRLLAELRRIGAPASVRLAILEHAAHTELPPSTRLSAGLMLADEHSTTTAFGSTLDLDVQGADDLLAVLEPAPHRVEGYCRPDMARRAARAAERLLRP